MMIEENEIRFKQLVFVLSALDTKLDWYEGIIVLSLIPNSSKYGRWPVMGYVWSQSNQSAKDWQIND